MKALLWKDYRHNRPFLAAAGALLLFPYAFVVLIAVVELLTDDHSFEVVWAPYFQGASLAGLGILVVLSAFIAGNAVAGERADRSAEFVAYLPIARRSAIASKAILAMGVCLLIWLVNSSVYYAAVSVQGYGGKPGIHDNVLGMTVTTVFVFGVSWLVSTLVTRPAIAAVSGLGALAILWTAVLILEEAARILDHNAFAVWYSVLCLLLGSGCFVAGVVYYLRRVEP